MAVSLIAAAFRQELPAVEKLMLLALADSANDDDGGCFFLLKTLAVKTSLSERGARYVLRRLESAGYVRTEFRPNRSSIFYLSLERLGVIHSPGTGCPPVDNLGGHRMPLGGHGMPLGGHRMPLGGHGMPPYPYSSPSSDSLSKPLKPDVEKNPRNQKPEAEGFAKGKPEGGAGAPNRGGSGSRLPMAAVDGSPKPEGEVSEAQRLENIARLRSALLGLGIGRPK